MTTAVEGVLTSGCHRAELTAYCRRMLGSSFDAEDAVQETLLRAWRGSDRFEARASLRTWLYRIATNVCLDALGHSARRPVPVDELPERVDPDIETDPSNLALERERLRLAMVGAIGVLPRRQRAVLVLRDVLSWQASEAAELLGMTTAGVNSALQRAHAAVGAIDVDDLADTRDREGQQLLARYLAAFAEDDVGALVALSQEA
ncbi:MAG: sigma-70 family RNA polymerase sigma factor [Solirubrobacterales bacterium]|nr:sigma-70 family RNA polymerase sigma factor [Solirubrobacterales bacterium]